VRRGRVRDSIAWALTSARALAGGALRQLAGHCWAGGYWWKERDVGRPRSESCTLNTQLSTVPRSRYRYRHCERAQKGEDSSEVGAV
jgi:hypothetical protein